MRVIHKSNSPTNVKCLIDILPGDVFRFQFDPNTTYIRIGSKRDGEYIDVQGAKHSAHDPDVREVIELDAELHILGEVK